MVTVLQGTRIHAVPAAELLQPGGLLLPLTVGVQDDAHPQRTWGHAHTHTHTRTHTHTHTHTRNTQKKHISQQQYTSHSFCRVDS